MAEPARRHRCCGGVGDVHRRQCSESPTVPMPAVIARVWTDVRTPLWRRALAPWRR